ncbi:helix-turn-helix domain-containing protein [Saccharopolyspora sp. TS4A08]|uniref:Helix-turn-helix domain-containing protein n=1 Tax=Saccharopolyspora ipomoeae TaxID=3042027 RepID=A0ABT6PGE4_9PSEU|nr:TetR/AcrR family transcriptional regulator [Saccharopolyspora sp. TS4A08]MDI2027065.1 helix-turn-helix domain-containing protein [Saccharopolyspora sp. TS4A08]
MTTLRQQQKQRTRGALLTAARRLFVERGYAAVTVDDITTEVGCSRATFYLHFSGKPDVLRRIGAETVQQRAVSVYADLDEVLATGSRAEFAEWLRRAVAWFERNRDILPVWDEAVALEPSFRPIATEAVAELPAAMPRYLERWGEARSEEARLRVGLLVTQLERFFTRWAVQGTLDTGDTDPAVTLTDIWYPALLPPEHHHSTEVD